jgi:hypothetical protein
LVFAAPIAIAAILAESGETFEQIAIRRRNERR